MRRRYASRVLVVGMVVASALAGLTGCGPAGQGAAGPATTAPSSPGSPSSGSPSPIEPSSGSASPIEPSPSSPSPSSATTPPSGAPSSPTAPTAPAPSGSTPPTGTADGTLRPGDHGPQVLALQRRLTALGYWLGTPDGSYGDLTRQAVIALQKVAGIGRDGIAGPRTRAALARGARPEARTSSGHVIEVNLRRQVLLVVDDGRVTRILNTSTGSGAYYTAPDGHTAHATTPTGTFRVEWQVDAWHTSPLGRLYRPKYFHPRGIAVHGYPSVPAYPASHGCVRVSLPAMDMLWSQGLLPVGTRVTVF